MSSCSELREAKPHSTLSHLPQVGGLDWDTVAAGGLSLFVEGA